MQLPSEKGSFPKLNRAFLSLSLSCSHIINKKKAFGESEMPTHTFAILQQQLFSEALSCSINCFWELGNKSQRQRHHHLALHTCTAHSQIKDTVVKIRTQICCCCCCCSRDWNSQKCCQHCPSLFVRYAGRRRSGRSVSPSLSNQVTLTWFVSGYLRTGTASVDGSRTTSFGDCESVENQGSFCTEV